MFPSPSAAFSTRAGNDSILSTGLDKCEELAVTIFPLLSSSSCQKSYKQK